MHILRLYFAVAHTESSSNKWNARGMGRQVKELIPVIGIEFEGNIQRLICDCVSLPGYRPVDLAGMALVLQPGFADFPSAGVIYLCCSEPTSKVGSAAEKKRWKKSP
jgi:hypothetical protein